MDINEHWYHSQAAVIETSKFYDQAGNLSFNLAKERLIEHNEPLLRIRLTRLRDGGSVIAVATTHMFCDGPSYVDFLSSWSNTFQNLKHDIPFFCRPSIHFSPAIPISLKGLKIFINEKLFNFSRLHGMASFHINAIQLLKIQKKDRKNASEVILSATQSDSLVALFCRCITFDPSKNNVLSMPVNRRNLEADCVNVCRPDDINHEHIYKKKSDNVKENNSTGTQTVNEAVNATSSRYFGNNFSTLFINPIPLTAQGVRRAILKHIDGAPLVPSAFESLKVRFFCICFFI